MKGVILKISAIVLMLFAWVTLFMSSAVIFDLFGIREKEGNYVLFVVVSNFICGFLYLFSAVGFYSDKKWTTRLLILAAAILILSFTGLLLYVISGGLYETQTVKAMLFRISITLLFAGVSGYYISKPSGQLKSSG